MTVAGATWLAFRGGRSDRLRIALTVASTAMVTVFVLLAGAVVTPPDPMNRGPYANVVLWTEEGLRAGTVLAITLLCVPFIAFAAQCSRVGAPARERRFDDLARLGATSAELRRVAALESGIASVGGVVIGLPLYGLLVLVIGSIGGPVAVYRDLDAVPVRTEWMRDALLLPTDRVPTWWVVLPGLVLLPLLVAWVAVVGAACRGRAGATGATGATGPTGLVIRRSVVLVVVGLAGELGTALGVRIAGRAARADLLLAGRRMAAKHRRAASRLTLLLGCLIGGAVLVLRADALDLVARQGDTGGFFGQTYTLVIVGLGIATAVSALGLLVAEVEGVVERRRSLATAVAAGVPRGVLARAVVLESVLPVIPAVVLTTFAGAGVAVFFVGSVADDPAPLPLGALSLFVVAVSAVAVAAAALGTLALPASTDVSETRVPA